MNQEWQEAYCLRTYVVGVACTLQELGFVKLWVNHSHHPDAQPSLRMEQSPMWLSLFSMVSQAWGRTNACRTASTEGRGVSMRAP